MANLLIKLPEDVHQALRLASVIERKHQYVIVIELLREYLTKEGHLDEKDEGGDQ